MKILVVGDPHGVMKKIRKVPKRGIDMIIVTGDVGKADMARKFFFENVERKKKGLPEKERDAKYIRAEHMEIQCTITARRWEIPAGTARAGAA